MSFIHSSIDRVRYQNVNQNGENDGVSADFYEPGLQIAGIHFASIDEKKRLWWKNAFITAGCIASWYVMSGSVLCRRLVRAEHELGFSLLRFCPCITNGCSTQTVSGFPFHSSLLACTCGFSSFLLLLSVIYGQGVSDLRRDQTFVSIRRYTLSFDCAA